jgi:hypothetical protein
MFICCGGASPGEQRTARRISYDGPKRIALELQSPYFAALLAINHLMVITTVFGAAFALPTDHLNQILIEITNTRPILTKHFKSYLLII